MIIMSIGVGIGMGVGLLSSIEGRIGNLFYLVLPIIGMPELCMGMVLGYMVVRNVIEMIEMQLDDSCKEKRQGMRSGRWKSVVWTCLICQRKYENIGLIGGIVLCTIMGKMSLLPMGSIMMVCSVVILAICWGFYVFRQVNKDNWIEIGLIVGLIGLVAWISITLVGFNSTTLLFFGLYSLNSFSSSNLNSTNVQINKKKSEEKEVREIRIEEWKESWKGIGVGILGSVMIGFPTNAVLGREEKAERIMYKDMTESCCKGVSTALGLFFLFSQNISRDTTSTILSSLLGTSLLTINPIIMLVLYFILVNAVLYFGFNLICNIYLSLRDVLNAVPNSTSLITGSITIVFLLVINLGIWGLVVLTLAFIISKLCRRIQKESLASLVLLALPAFPVISSL